MILNLRELFETRNGKIEDKFYNHILDLAMDDQKQFITLTQAELNMLLDPAKYPPNSHETERFDEIRERLLESMAIIADIVLRRKLQL